MTVKTMITTSCRLAAVLLLSLSFGSVQAQNTPIPFRSTALGSDATLFQVSTLEALSVGTFQGAYPVGLLRWQGNFGLGTYDGIDGEMIVLDGRFYHARADGSVTESPDTELSSFAAVVNFVPQKNYRVQGMSMAQLDSFIASIIPSDNYFYAIRIHGQFSSVTTRAIGKLTPPYPALSEALKEQKTFTRDASVGTAVVIRSPEYVSNLNVAGNHYHFISDDRQFGGHALDLTLADGTLEIQEVRRNTIFLPENGAFQQAPLPDPTE